MFKVIKRVVIGCLAAIGLLIVISAVVGVLVWCGVISPTAFLPILEFFIGRSVDVETADFTTEPTTAETSRLTLTLPSGWDQEGDEQETDSSWLVRFVNEDDDSVVIREDQVDDADEFIMNLTNEYASSLEAAGLTVTQGVVKERGEDIHTIRGEGPTLIAEQRTWYCEDSERVYSVTLTSSPENLVASAKIFDSFTCHAD